MLKPGEVLAGYRIERTLGVGGMGAVYLAAHPSLPRRDALKVLSAELSHDPDFRTRFLREADVASSLDHPNIVGVYDRGQTEDGQLWISMQFVDGTDADAALRAGEMTPDRAIHIVAAVAQALDHAHSRNIIHRDVKPANFLLAGAIGPSERVLLGDFGIARALDDVGLTATGSLVATVAYAAPEVLSGLSVDGRADIYSLGCTLFRLLTGKPPFTNNGMAAVMMAHLQAPPPRVTDFVSSLPTALDAVIAIAMAKDPAARFPTAAALAAAAGSALHDATVLIATPLPAVSSRDVSSYPQPGTLGWHDSDPGTMLAPGAVPPVATESIPPPLNRRRSAGWIVASLAAVVVFGVAALIVWPRGSSPAPPRAQGNNPATAGSSTTTAGPTSTTPTRRPATDVTPDQLRSILLSDSQIAAIAGGAALTMDSDTTELLANASVSSPPCRGAWSPAQQSVYAGSGRTGAAVQTLRALGVPVWQDGVIQAAVSLDSVMSISAFMQDEQRRWVACAQAGAVTVTLPDGAAQSWTFSPPVTTGGIVTLTATPAEGGDGSCSRGIAARGNVVIDMRLRRLGRGGNVAALIRAAGDQVPRQ
ncbi:serine/threonine-protein kinase PknH/PknJ [Mycobacterium pseudoshottsii]|uniref:non-specific serine/threonine protein kinase n=1 Tax=Mycobacterium pseudoshottsii TaxID=265949 RepID=A0A9N7LXH8_9MYCO|nr:serine/threonine-protein kinase PknH/PknJ [Mycobacterium pseudoshottsii]BDN85383.1 serine/threonine-protein kinase PknJ [Mycobacterium pseudoshottsii]